MVDEELGIDPEQLIQEILVIERAAGYVAHGENAVTCQTGSYAASHAPEIGEWLMRPQLTAVAHLVELGYAHAVAVGWHLLGHYIHGNLGEIEVCPYPGCGCDACLGKHLAYHLHGELVGCQAICGEI